MGILAPLIQPRQRPFAIFRTVVSTDVGDEILIIDLDIGEMFSLSGSASEVLEAIDGDHGTSDIAVITATSLDASSQDIERNIDIVVSALTNYRLVDLVNWERFLVQKERTVLSPLKAFQDGQEQ